MDENEKNDGLHVLDGVEHIESHSDTDWNPDNFPTSAKPIFRAGDLLLAIVAALCFAVYSCSEHPEPKVKKKAAPAEAEAVDDDSVF